MRLSDAGLDFVAHEEGCVLHVYPDAVGVRTIGVGHALRLGEEYPDGISRDAAMALLREDVAVAERAVTGAVVVELTQNQFDALVSLAFNIGGHAFAASTLVRILNGGDYEGAASQFAVWRMGGGGVLPGLVARRERERVVFMSPGA